MKTYILSLFLLVSLFCSAHEGGNFVASDMLAGMHAVDKRLAYGTLRHYL